MKGNRKQRRSGEKPVPGLPCDWGTRVPHRDVSDTQKAQMTFEGRKSKGPRRRK